MYLNDNSRAAFYEALGLDTRLFNQHVIIETNKSTARLFPEVGGHSYPITIFPSIIFPKSCPLPSCLTLLSLAFFLFRSLTASTLTSS